MKEHRATSTSRAPLLTKTKFCVGLQCHKRLWWTVREPDAPELVPDSVTQYRFDVGHAVGERARLDFPGGRLIDSPPWEKAEAAARTARAMEEGLPSVHEAAFESGGVHVRVDVLTREADRAWRIVEVKSTTRLKWQHIPDLAVQLATLEGAGVTVAGTELMHLNRRCRHPDLSTLFARTECTEEAREFLPRVPGAVRAMQEVLDGGAPPAVAIGGHCFTPYECPFLDRCRPEPPPHHISELYGVRGKLRARIEAAGTELVSEIPGAFPLTEIQERQRRAVLTGEPVVTPSLERRLREPEYPLCYLDFETCAPAIPEYPGTGPYNQVPFQFSLHLLNSDLLLEHREFLDESDDPRPPLAAALLEALGGQGTIVTYGVFERTVLRNLTEAVPERGRELQALRPRIWDMHRVIQSGLYHPDFRGSLSLKSVYPALCPGSGYEGLEVTSGQEAAVLYAELRKKETDEERKEQIRRDLLAYCSLDTKAMVEIHKALRLFV